MPNAGPTVGGSVAAAKPVRTPPAAHSQDSAAGVDAFGRVTKWQLFSNTTRNERQAQQAERARRLQQAAQTQQQADLASEAAAAQVAYHNGGLAQMQAWRDAVDHLARTKQATAARVQARREAAQAEATERARKSLRATAGTGVDAGVPEAPKPAAPARMNHRVEGGAGPNM